MVYIKYLHLHKLKIKGEYLPLLISIFPLVGFARSSLYNFITLVATLIFLVVSEIFSSILISNNLKYTSIRVSEFLFLSLQKIYYNNGILTPTNDARLRSILAQQIDYSVELGCPTKLTSAKIENKELLEAEKALFQLDDKYALHLLIIFGFPLLYFLLGLFFYISSFNLVLLIILFYSVATIFYSYLSDETYSFEGISISLQDILGSPPFGLKDLQSFESYLDLNQLEISHLPILKPLSQAQTIVGTLLQSTIRLPPNLKRKIFMEFLTSFQSFKEKETIFLAKQKVQKYKHNFAIFAISCILGIFIAISHSIFALFSTLPMNVFPISFAFPPLLPEFTGLLFASLNKGYFKPIFAFAFYYFIFIVITSIFSNIILFPN